MPLRPTSIAAALLVLLSAPNLFAQSTQAASSPTVSVPRLIHISGVYRPADRGQAAGVEAVTLAIYGDETGGAPLWHETQSVSVDASGRYSLLLGANEADGIPLHVFASGEARWLGMTWSRPGEVEAPRTRLTSVPYALKASDADTLGGRPASEYLLTPSARGQTPDASTASGDTGASPDVISGAAGLLPKYYNSIDLGPSAVYEAAGRVGINTSAPRDVVHSQFYNTDGALTGFAVQNMGNTASSYSGMLFYDHTGALGQFQGFNNLTKEYRINNVAPDGSINFMLGSSSKLRIHPSFGVEISAPAAVYAVGAASPGFSVYSTGPEGIVSANTAFQGTAVEGRGLGLYGWGISGYTDGGVGVYGRADPSGWAGYFSGNATVTGILFKGGGAFKIDHPLDPQNKYLSHSFVESPDMKNIYDGVAVLDQAGEAIVTLPEWFEALNENFRYQVTPMGTAFVPYVADEIAGNKFKIAGGIPGKKVSWMVTGIRRDAYANANRIQVEELKTGPAAGTYLHPEAFGLVPDKDQSDTASDPQAREERMKARLRAISYRPPPKK